MIKNKPIKYAIACCLIFGVLYLIANIFAPGSYQGAMRYEIKATENQVVKAVRAIKNRTGSQLQLQQLGLEDGRNGSGDHWYHFYLYDVADGSVLNCWLREEREAVTTLALVSIRKSTGKWKVFGRDFTRVEAQEQIKRFEDVFFNQLKTAVDIEKNNRGSGLNACPRRIIKDDSQ